MYYIEIIIRVENYSKTIYLNIMQLAHYSIILGIP
jgi:hypothetical protein